MVKSLSVSCARLIFALLVFIRPRYTPESLAQATAWEANTVRANISMKFLPEAKLKAIKSTNLCLSQKAFSSFDSFTLVQTLTKKSSTFRVQL